MLRRHAESTAGPPAHALDHACDALGVRDRVTHRVREIAARIDRIFLAVRRSAPRHGKRGGKHATERFPHDVFGGLRFARRTALGHAFVARDVPTPITIIRFARDVGPIFFGIDLFVDRVANVDHVHRRVLRRGAFVERTP